MRVLVTGANGFVGRHLCKHLVGCGDIVVEARGPPGDDRKPDPLSVDLTVPGTIRDALETARPDVVIHLAGFSSVGKSHEEPARAFAVNALGAVHLLAAVRDVTPRTRILLVASAEMYGALPAGVRATEDFPLRPLSPYASSKVAAEAAGFQFHRADGLDVISPRPFNHIGSGQSPNFVIPSFAAQIQTIRAGRSRPVLHVGDLSPVRDFSHVADVVEAYRLIALRGRPGEAYNVCSGEGRSIRSLVDEMLELSGVVATVEVDPRRLRRAELPVLVGDPTKLRTLGWRPSRSVRDALGDALASASPTPADGEPPDPDRVERHGS